MLPYGTQSIRFPLDKEIQYDIFSGFIAGLEEVRGRPEHQDCTRCLRPLFSVCGGRVLLCMGICGKLRYNFDAGRE